MGLTYFKAVRSAAYEPDKPRTPAHKRALTTEDVEALSALKTQQNSPCEHQLWEQGGSHYHQCCREPEPTDKGQQSHQHIFAYSKRTSRFTVHDSFTHLLCQPCLEKAQQEDPELKATSELATSET